MKKIILGAAALTLSTSVLAANVGWNLGAEAGYNKYYNTSTNGTVFSGTASTSGLGYGAYAGYNFSQYFGLRVGYNKYSDLKLKSGGTKYGFKYYSVSALAMGYYPLNQQFDLMGGAGFAYVNESNGKNVSGRSEDFYRPQLLVGGSYNFDQNWSVFAAYSYIFGKGKMKDAASANVNKDKGTKYLPTITLLSFGVNYSF